MKKRQLTRPEPATSRSIVDPLEGNGSMDAGGDHGSAAKGSAIDLEVAGSGLVSCHFFIPFSFLSCVVL